VAKLVVLSTHAVVEVLAELVPAFERANGCTLSFRYNPTAVTKREIESGVEAVGAASAPQSAHESQAPNVEMLNGDHRNHCREGHARNLAKQGEKQGGGYQ